MNVFLCARSLRGRSIQFPAKASEGTIRGREEEEERRGSCTRNCTQSVVVLSTMLASVSLSADRHGSGNGLGLGVVGMAAQGEEEEEELGSVV